MYLVYIYLIYTPISPCRAPDRHWSSVDEITLPETHPYSGIYTKETHKPYGPDGFSWSFGPRVGRRDSFYSTHISSCQRLANGNTLSK